MDCSGYSTNRAQQQDDGSASWASSSSTTSFEGAAAFEQSAELNAASTSPQPTGADAALQALEGRVHRGEVANILDGLVAEMTANLAAAEAVIRPSSTATAVASGWSVSMVITRRAV